MKYHGENLGLEPYLKEGDKRQVNPLSKRNEKVRQLQAQVEASGGIWYGDGEWTDDQTDLLLKLFFEHCANSLRSKRVLELACGRSFDALGSKLRKLAIRYDETTTRAYYPSGVWAPDQRQGSPWVVADYAFIAKATSGEGIPNHAYQPSWLGLLLGRPANEIASWLYMAVGKLPTKGMLFSPSDQELLTMNAKASAEARGFGLWK